LLLRFGFAFSRLLCSLKPLRPLPRINGDPEIGQDSKMFLFFLAQTQAASPAASSGASGLFSILPFVFIFVIMYYVMLRPQMRRQKEQARLVSSLKTGDKVVTASGIHGLISNVKETTVIVKVADNVKIEMEKTAVTNVVKSGAES
jgi:preprotein translocase subunit YajC